MECLTVNKTQAYIDGTLNDIENAMIRDHLIQCEACSRLVEKYQAIELSLSQPVMIEPPDEIEKVVFRNIFSILPSYSSIAMMIGFALVGLISGIYIYFDFANNSVIQAFQQTSMGFSNWIGSVIKIIAGFFSGVYAFLRSLKSILNILLNTNRGGEILGFVFAFGFLLLLYYSYRFTKKLIKGHRS